MKITHYLAIIDAAYVINNKLEKDVAAHLFEINRMLIPAEKLKVAKEDILFNLHSFNRRHPRCKPFTLKFEASNEATLGRGHDFELTGYGKVIFHLKACEL